MVKCKVKMEFSIKVKNAPNIISLFFSRLDITITIISHKNIQYNSYGRKYDSSRYNVRAIIKNKQTGKLLEVESVSFEEVHEIVDNKIINESELSIKRTGIRFDCSAEEHALRFVLDYALFYDRYKNNYEFEKNFIAGFSPEEVFIKLKKMKDCKNFLMEVLNW